MTKYDFLILGGGVGGLSIAALLASRGKRVCVLEKSGVLGGWAKTERIGDFQFVAGAQYLNGATTAGSLWKFLGALGLDKEIAFNHLDPKGYDIALSDSTKFAIPSGIDNLIKKLQEHFPEESVAIQDYFNLTRVICNEVDIDAGIVHTKKVISGIWKYKTFVRHLTQTPAEVFKRFNFSPELKFVLYSQGGDLGLPSYESSFPLLSALHNLYGESAVFPAKGIEFFINKIAEKIRRSHGCDIVLNCEVEEIIHSGSEVSRIKTSSGTFEANEFISNLDPNLTYELAGRPKKSLLYSDAPFILNLCFSNYDVAPHGFGNFNYWIHGSEDPDYGFKQMREKLQPVDPWIFLSTPSHIADPGTVAPVGSSSMTMLTFASYDKLLAMRERSTKAFEDFSSALEQHFFSVLAKKFNLPSSKVSAKIWRTPFDFASDIGVPSGNVYGPELSPRNYSLFKISQKSLFRNLAFNGAASAFPGIMPICVGAMDLCDYLLKSEPGYVSLLGTKNKTGKKAS
jgi:all-trans-retinol 13,14-reductase